MFVVQAQFLTEQGKGPGANEEGEINEGEEASAPDAAVENPGQGKSTGLVDEWGDETNRITNTDLLGGSGGNGIGSVWVSVGGEQDLGDDWDDGRNGEIELALSVADESPEGE